MDDLATELLREFEQFVDLEDLAFDEEGMCRLQFQDQYACIIHHDVNNQRLVLVAAFARPSQISNEAFSSLLAFNTLRIGAPGPWVSLDKTIGVLLLAQDFYLPTIERSTFKKSLTSFFQQYLLCQGFIDEGSLDSSPDSSTQSEVSPTILA